MISNLYLGVLCLCFMYVFKVPDTCIPKTGVLLEKTSQNIVTENLSSKESKYLHQWTT